MLNQSEGNNHASKINFFFPCCIRFLFYWGEGGGGGGGGGWGVIKGEKRAIIDAPVGKINFSIFVTLLSSAKNDIFFSFES